MSSLLAEIGLSEQLILSYIIGIAGAPAVYPYVRSLENIAWSSHSVMPPDAKTLAAGVAQGQVNPSQAAAWAAETGFGSDQFNALIDIANVGPGTAYAFELWRRGQIDEAGFRRAVKRLGLEQEWIDDLAAIKQALLTPEQLAVMIQRTVVANPGILPNQPSTSGSNVPPMPQVNIDPLVEAAGMGISEERLAAMARIIGLPASPDLAARMHFRGIITEGAYNQAILEGNTRGEWAPFLLDGFRQILTVDQYVEGHLRGWIDQATMYAGTAKHGMTQADTDLLFEIHGRPVTTHEITTGLARGGTYPSQYTDVPEPYRKAIQESNIRPEWASIHYANRYSYPSAFVLRSLAQAGDLGGQAAVEQVLREIGWKPSFAQQVSTAWTQGSTTGDPHVGKAQTTAWSKAQASYIAEESTAADVQPIFQLLGVPAAAQTEVIGLWDAIRALTRKQLTPAQVKKAWAEGAINPATGQPWTQQEAIDALLARGYDQADATTLLEL